MLKEYSKDKRIVLTLDAGGTTFTFSAMQGFNEIIEPLTLPSEPDNLEKCINLIIAGFEKMKNSVNEKITAISFAFPGPADYPLGIIEDLPNLSAFRGGVPLGSILNRAFNVPVFINNDGDLFAYGEAIAGLLKDTNEKLSEAGSPKRYNNLLGITLGTGFGGGIVRNNELFIGDNSGAGEIWLMRNRFFSDSFAEQTSNIKAVKRFYKEFSNASSKDELSPKDIFEIAEGKKTGERDAAIKAYQYLGKSVGDALANAITLIDGLIVIGGGMSPAQKYFMPALIEEMNSSYQALDGSKIARLEFKVFNLEDENQLPVFLKGKNKEITVPIDNSKIVYDSMRRIGVGISKLGTAKAVSIGAYTFALKKIDKD